MPHCLLAWLTHPSTKDHVQYLDGNLQLMLRHCGRHYQVEPRGEPVTGTCDLDLDDRRSLLVVLTAQLLPSDGCWTLGEYCTSF